MNDGEVLVEIVLREFNGLGGQLAVDLKSDGKGLLSPGHGIHVLRVLADDGGVLLDHAEQLAGQFRPEHAYIRKLLSMTTDREHDNNIKRRTSVVDNAVIPNRVQVSAHAEPADLNGVASLIVFVAARTKLELALRGPMIFKGLPNVQRLMNITHKVDQERDRRRLNIAPILHNIRGGLNRRARLDLA